MPSSPSCIRNAPLGIVLVTIPSRRTGSVSDVSSGQRANAPAMVVIGARNSAAAVGRAETAEDAGGETALKPVALRSSVKKSAEFAASCERPIRGTPRAWQLGTVV